MINILTKINMSVKATIWERAWDTYPGQDSNQD